MVEMELRKWNYEIMTGEVTLQVQTKQTQVIGEDEYFYEAQ
jgi:hypothetical protein